VSSGRQRWQGPQSKWRGGLGGGLLWCLYFGQWCAVLAHASWILQLRAEQSNRPDASQQGVAVVSERALALERTGESSQLTSRDAKRQAISKFIHTHTKRQERVNNTTGCGPQMAWYLCQFANAQCEISGSG
jgi:hypothetical protein